MNVVCLGKPSAIVQKWIDSRIQKPYLCFQAFEGPVSIGLRECDDVIQTQTFNVSIEWSHDASAWNLIATNDVTILLEPGQKVYFRAREENLTLGHDGILYQFQMSSSVPTAYVNASGNVQSLLKADCSRTDAPDECFSYMFKGCRILRQAPSLPATRLSKLCYLNMFSGCISLSSAPVLPATQLADRCYLNMFDASPEVKTVSMPNIYEESYDASTYGSLATDHTISIIFKQRV